MIYLFSIDVFIFSTLRYLNKNRTKLSKILNIFIEFRAVRLLSCACDIFLLRRLTLILFSVNCHIFWIVVVWSFCSVYLHLSIWHLFQVNVVCLAFAFFLWVVFTSLFLCLPGGLLITSLLCVSSSDSYRHFWPCTFSPQKFLASQKVAPQCEHRSLIPRFVWMECREIERRKERLFCWLSIFCRGPRDSQGRDLKGTTECDWCTGLFANQDVRGRGNASDVLETQKTRDDEIENLKEDVLKMKEKLTSIIAEIVGRDRRKANLIVSGLQ